MTLIFVVAHGESPLKFQGFLRLFGHPSIITTFCNDAVKML